MTTALEAGAAIAVVKPTSWAETVRLGKVLGHWTFRGQASAEWPMSSSIERAAAALRSPMRYLGSREHWMHVQFSRRAHHYLPDPPQPERHVEWLALMQHHGAPTRLLDFTRSFYVAAFFALEGAAGDAAIWAINLSKLETFADAVVPEAYGPNSTIHDHYRSYLRRAELIIGRQESAPYVLPVEPERLNERLSIQQGLFLMGCDISRPFLDNLAGSLGTSAEALRRTVDLQPAAVDVRCAVDSSLLKIVLPHSLQYEAMKDLRSMNISAATLFPGLDGFARSLSFHVHDPFTSAGFGTAGLS